MRFVPLLLAAALPASAQLMGFDGAPALSPFVVEDQAEPETLAETSPTEADPRVAAEARAVAAALCGSDDAVLVLDNFSPRAERTVDVDGDGAPDVAHGDFIAALYRSRGRAVIERDIGADTLSTALAKLLEGIAAEVESGALRIAAVSFSQAIDVRLSKLETGGSAGVAAARERLAAETARAAKLHEDEDIDFERLLAAAERLRRAGVPILGIAGNQGPSRMNLLNVLPGTVAIGGLARDGRRAGFSADHSLIGLWALAEHSAAAVPGGVDLDGDGLADIGTPALTGGASRGRAWAGVSVDEAVSDTWPDDPYIRLYSRETRGGLEKLQSLLDPAKLYSLEFLAEYYKLPPHRLRAFEARGRFFDRSLRLGFDAGADGRIVYDPAGTGAPAQLALLSGTSFAPPFICPAR